MHICQKGKYMSQSNGEAEKSAEKREAASSSERCLHVASKKLKMGVVTMLERLHTSQGLKASDWCFDWCLKASVQVRARRHPKDALIQTNRLIREVFDERNASPQNFSEL